VIGATSRRQPNRTTAGRSRFRTADYQIAPTIIGVAVAIVAVAIVAKRLLE
jgi:hypothetical protein